VLTHNIVVDGCSLGYRMLSVEFSRVIFNLLERI
jgi:hypothetical protein